MSFPILGLPVHGPLHDADWVRPPGNTDMRITQDAASHAARILNGKHRAMALDIGDGDPDADDILAVHAGKIAVAATVGSANLAIEWTEVGVVWQAVYAHDKLPHLVKVGQMVTLGQVIDKMGMTGATALHLHLQIGYLKGAEWVWVDPEPLLFAPGEDGMDASFAPKPNATVTVNPGARHRTAPTTADSSNIAIASDPGGPLGFPLMGTVVGLAVSGNAIWYAYWRPETKKVYYLHTSTCGPETPWQATDCTDAVTKATAPLVVRINAAKAALG